MRPVPDVEAGEDSHNLIVYRVQHPGLNRVPIWVPWHLILAGLSAPCNLEKAEGEVPGQVLPKQKLVTYAVPC